MTINNIVVMQKSQNYNAKNKAYLCTLMTFPTSHFPNISQLSLDSTISYLYDSYITRIKMYWSTHIFSVIVVLTNSEATKYDVYYLSCDMITRCVCNHCRFLHACVVLSQQFCIKKVRLFSELLLLLLLLLSSWQLRSCSPKLISIKNSLIH